MQRVALMSPTGNGRRMGVRGAAPNGEESAETLLRPAPREPETAQPAPGTLNRGLFSASWSGQWAVSTPVTYLPVGCSPDRQADYGAMTPTSVHRLALSPIVAGKPGLLQGKPDRGCETNKRADDEGWSVPFFITLPVTVLISLALWAGLVLAVRALF